MLFGIAFRNVKRQLGGYFIYFVTVALTVSVLFSLNSFIFSEVVETITREAWIEVKVTSGFLSVVLGCVVSAVLGYGCAFLMRRRKKEFGLYLTLGMSRSDIQKLFAAELFFTFTISLGAGLGLGMLVYQGIVFGFSQFYHSDLVLGDYSAWGFLITIIEVGFVFLLSSAFSLAYLRRVTIAKLLQGKETHEKTVKSPRAWLRVTIAFAVILVISLIAVVVAVGNPGIGGYAAIMVGGSGMVFVSIVLVYVGAMKSVVPSLLANKKFSCRGTRTFTLRQLSGRLSVDSAVFGLIAALLTFAIVCGNLFFAMYGSQVTRSHYTNPYTVDIRMPYDATGELTDDVPEWLEAFGEVESCHKFDVYQLSSRWTNKNFTSSFVNPDRVIRESDYLILAEMIGEKATPVGDGIVILNNGSLYDDYKYIRSVDYSDLEFEIGEYSLPVTYVSPVMETLVLSHKSNLITVVPDEVVDKIVAGEILYESAYTECPVVYKNGVFDERALSSFFSDKSYEDVYREALENSPHSYGQFFYPDIGGSFLSTLMGMAAPWMLIVFFLTVIFALSSMAVLGLKSISAVSEDRRRYKLLYLAGATEKEVLRSLIVQLVLYFLLPFVLPLLMNIPASFIGLAIGRLMGYLSVSQVIGFAALFSGTLLVLFGLYCAMTCFISRKEIKRALRRKG